jgi:hypothetical protein
MRAFRTLIIVLLLLCLVPPLSLLGATLVARWAKCELDQGAPVPCTILGSDLGDFLFKVADFGYYTVEAIPTFVALLTTWVIVEIIRSVGRPKKRHPSQTPAASRNRTRGS